MGRYEPASAGIPYGRVLLVLFGVLLTAALWFQLPGELSDDNTLSYVFSSSQDQASAASLGQTCATGWDTAAVLQPADAASLEAVLAAGWPVSLPDPAAHFGSPGDSNLSTIIGRGLSEVDLKPPAPLRLRFRGYGVVRLTLAWRRKAPVSNKTSSLDVRLNGATALIYEAVEESSLSLAYTSGDLLELVATPAEVWLAGQGPDFILKAVEVLLHRCDATPPGEGNAGAGCECSAWQRVRLPWTSGEDPKIPVGSDANASRMWIEGRVSRVLNSTHALVQVPNPAQQFDSQQFDPKSPLNSYSDAGTCGARGDDAKADLSVCPLGAELVRKVPNDHFKAQASEDQCDYFAFDIYRCIHLTVPRMSMVEVSASMLAPLDEAPPFGFLDSSNSLAPEGRRGRCQSFRSEPDKKIAVVLFGDAQFEKGSEGQVKSVQCFADRHGYEFRRIRSAEFPSCKDIADLRFRRHCAVAAWLDKQSPDLVAAVIDTETVVAVPQRGLEKWAKHVADVQLYPHCVKPGIVASNFMVRNSQFSRSFLRKWAQRYKRAPLGLPTAEEDGLLMVMLELAQKKGFYKCNDAYAQLSKNTSNSSQHDSFVHCVLDNLGAPKVWHPEGGAVALWPRLNFWSADGAAVRQRGSRGVGPIFHIFHGEGEAATAVAAKYYTDPSSQCQLNEPNVLAPETDFGGVMLGVASGHTKLFPAGLGCDNAEPWQCNKQCIPAGNCLPMGDRPAAACG